MSKECGDPAPAEGSATEISPSPSDAEKGVTTTRADNTESHENNREVDFYTRNGLNMASFQRRGPSTSTVHKFLCANTPQVDLLMARFILIDL